MPGSANRESAHISAEHPIAPAAAASCGRSVFRGSARPHSRFRNASPVSELEATERVLARYSKGTRTTRSASTRATRADAPARGRGRRRTTTAGPAASERTSPSLGDQILALATGKTQKEIAAACKGVRPNHVGIAIARHKRAGHIEERDGKLYATQSAGTEQRTV
jgi:hypothetical protein